MGQNLKPNEPLAFHHFVSLGVLELIYEAFGFGKITNHYMWFIHFNFYFVCFHRRYFLYFLVFGTLFSNHLIIIIMVGNHFQSYNQIQENKTIYKKLFYTETNKMLVPISLML
jgi:hypothetical protein